MKTKFFVTKVAMKFFLICPLLNNKKNKYDGYKKILNGSMDEKIINLGKFQEEQKQRKKSSGI